MKKRFWIFVLLLVFLVSMDTWAIAETITRDVTVKGDNIRGPLVAGLIGSYFPDTKGTAVEDKTLSEYVIVTGPGGEEKIHFSPKLVTKLQKLAANPRAGEGLMDVCPSQARALIKVVGPIGVSTKVTALDSQDPKIDFLKVTEKTSICQKSGGCYGKAPTGYYQTLQPYNGIRMVSNSGNHKYPENSISFKIEYHRAGLTGWSYGTNWGPTIVLRNITMESPVRLVDVNASLILPYLERITALKKGQPGNEGDSCWEVVLLRDGTVYKDESPAEAPFRRK